MRSEAKSRIYEYRLICPTQSSFEKATQLVNSSENIFAIHESDTDADVDEDCCGRIDESAAVAKDAVLSHRYLMHEQNAWCLPSPLNIAAMQQAADVLRNDSQETDYTSFRNSGCNSVSPIRKVLNISVSQVPTGESEFYPESNTILITVEATSFLLRMVRNFVAVMVHVGQGKASPEIAAKYLELRDRNAIKLKPAPAEGLYLKDVIYDEEG